MKFDFLVVGSGCFGAAAARTLAEAGHLVLVIDQRPHIGGNCYDKKFHDIPICKYGAHIFHTNSLPVWKWVNRFSKFNSYRHKVFGVNNKTSYSLPFSMHTFSQLWGINTPDEAREKLRQVTHKRYKDTKTVESWCLNNLGPELYELLVRGYTEKQWQRPASKLPESIIKRLPIRFDYNTDYFTDRYQGMPVDGYTAMFEQILDHPKISVRLNTVLPQAWHKHSRALIYSGRLDDLFDYDLGTLEFLTLNFLTRHEGDDRHAAAVMNHTSAGVPYTRTIEHRFFHPGSKQCLITEETPVKWHPGAEPYYPVPTKNNRVLANKYKRRVKETNSIFTGGRLGDYQYLNMDQAIASGLQLGRKLS